MTNINQFAKDPRPAIVLASTDRERLLAVASAAMESAPSVASFLLQELERGDIIPTSVAVAFSVVMGSEVTFIDHQTNRILQARLVYPDEAHDDDGLISVLTPTGAALLGLGPGQSIGWRAVDGETLRLGVLKVHPPPAERSQQ